MSRRLALLTPFAFPSIRGNAVTVERIARGLRARGADLEIWDLSSMTPTSLERRASEYHPALIHAFHAYRAGPLGLTMARRIGTAASSTNPITKNATSEMIATR